MDVQVLLVCGSLQRRSANRAALELVATVTAAMGAIVDDYDGLAQLPAFDADHEAEPIAAVEDWRQRAADADAVVVAVPEYAGALAGAVKNAFDWLVGSGGVYRKPVGVLSAGTSGGAHARRMMAQTLTWQGAYVVSDLGIASPRTKSDDAGRIVDPDTVAGLDALARTVVAACSWPADEQVARAATVVGGLGVPTEMVRLG